MKSIKFGQHSKKERDLSNKKNVKFPVSTEQERETPILPYEEFNDSIFPDLDSDSPPGKAQC